MDMLGDGAIALGTYLLVRGVKEIAATFNVTIDGARTVVVAGVVASALVGAYNYALSNSLVPDNVASLVALLIAWAGSAGFNSLVKTVAPKRDALALVLATLTDAERAALMLTVNDATLAQLAPVEPRRLLARVYAALGGLK